MYTSWKKCRGAQTIYYDRKPLACISRVTETITWDQDVVKSAGIEESTDEVEARILNLAESAPRR